MIFVQKGRICVPIDVSKIDQFDPFTVPLIDELCEQLERCDLISIDSDLITIEGFWIKIKNVWSSINLYLIRL